MYLCIYVCVCVSLCYVLMCIYISIRYAITSVCNILIFSNVYNHFLYNDYTNKKIKVTNWYQCDSQESKLKKLTRAPYHYHP